MRNVFCENTVRESDSAEGIVTGLAWISAGGEILFVETLLTKGSGKVQIAIIPVKKVTEKRIMKELSTLCYIEKDGKYLMLHRTVKENDVNKDKWIGVGGHFEKNESPEECLLREVKEETGYTLTSWQYRGIVTFVYGEDTIEYMSLYTADGFEGTPIPCDEGELEWVDKKAIYDLELWEGDKIFFRLLEEGRPFFSLKLVYDQKDVLQYVALDGKELKEELR